MMVLEKKKQGNGKAFQKKLYLCTSNNHYRNPKTIRQICPKSPRLATRTTDRC